MNRTIPLPQRGLPKSLPAMALILSIALLTLAARATQAESARYEIDPEHLSIGFLVDHIGYARTLGFARRKALLASTSRAVNSRH